MNANFAPPSGPHLDLTELVAEANGQLAGAQAREHLAGCEECRLEASRWTLVADGVRSLAAAVSETARPAPARPARARPAPARSKTTAPGTTAPGTTGPGTTGPGTAGPGTTGPGTATPEALTPGTATPGTATREAASPGRATLRPAAALSGLRRSGRRPGAPTRNARQGRRARLAGTAAAGLVLIGGAVYGVAASNLVHVSWNGHGSGAPAVTALTTVTGCSRLMQANGTLTQVAGDRLVITTASGQRVTVATSASTFVAETGALRGDITDGSPVTVGGPRSAGMVDALLVTIGNPSNDHPQLPSGDVVVKGTVTGATAGGFTVVTASGTRVAVSTSSETVVNVMNPGHGALPAGGTVYAIGQAGPGGTLAARAVAVIAELPAGGPQLHTHLSVKDCSPASVNGAVMALADGA